jgi:hypothetical protein
MSTERFDTVVIGGALSSRVCGFVRRTGVLRTKPRTRRSPGRYVVGLRFLFRIASSLVRGVGPDARPSPTKLRRMSIRVLLSRLECRDIERHGKD